MGLAAILWTAEPAAIHSVAAVREPAGQAAPDLEAPAGEAAEDADNGGGARDNGGVEFRASVLGGTFEGTLYGAEASAALFTAPREDEPLQFGLEAQIRYANDTDPEGTLEDASLTALTGNLVVRGAHGRFRPYAGVGAGLERYYYDSSFTNTTGAISGFVPGFRRNNDRHPPERIP